MEIQQVNKMLAYSFVSEIIKNKKIKKRDFSDVSALDSENAFNAREVDSANMSFGDLESYYKNVLSVIENTPEIRNSIVSALKNYQSNGGDLNSLYPTELIVKEDSLNKVLFLD